MSAFIGVIGGILGIILLLWRVYDEFTSYIRISIKAESLNADWVTAMCTVDNKGPRKKVIDHAFILIGPESENPVETANVIFEKNGINKIETTNDLFYIKVSTDVINNGTRSLIKLPFFYKENIKISDETMTYKYPIPIVSFPKNEAFSVRFFISDSCHLHRSTHDCFITNQ